MRLAGRRPRAQRGVDTAGPLRLDRVDKRDRQRNRAYGCYRQDDHGNYGHMLCSRLEVYGACASGLTLRA